MTTVTDRWRNLGNVTPAFWRTRLVSVPSPIATAWKAFRWLLVEASVSNARKGTIRQLEAENTHLIQLLNRAHSDGSTASSELTMRSHENGSAGSNSSSPSGAHESTSLR